MAVICEVCGRELRDCVHGYQSKRCDAYGLPVSDCWHHDHYSELRALIEALRDELAW